MAAIAARMLVFIAGANWPHTRIFRGRWHAWLCGAEALAS
jgi:hypothetical protein